MKRGWCLPMLVLLGLLSACVTPTPAPTAVPTPPPSATTVPPSAATPTPGPRTGWWSDAVFYEVFVRSFYDSDGNGIGDLQGLIAKLDYLNDGDPQTDTDLGVTALWLMPIMESPSYHGYDVVDYYTVEKDYGANEDFKQLIAEAHKRGIRVIIDLVLNHTSSQNPWFLESVRDPASPKRDWYIWEDQDPKFLGPWKEDVWYERNGAYYYAIFWSEMPDLNYHTPAVTAQVNDIARYWLQEMGADGFRLDAVRYLVEQNLLEKNRILASSPENLRWLQEFRGYYTALDPEAMTIGEVWTETSEAARYVNRGAQDLVFEFDLADALLSSVMTGSPSKFQSTRQKVLESYPPGQYGTFLTNHDQNRVMNVLQSDLPKAKLAAAALLTIAGVPFLYYGEEIGMVGAKPDEKIRTPFQWSAEKSGGFTTGSPWEPLNEDYTTVNVAAQEQDPGALLNTYRQLIHLRQAHAALRTGSFTAVTSSAGLVDAFLREQADDRVLVALNFDGQAQAGVTLSLQAGPLPAGTYSVRDALTGADLPALSVGEGGQITGYTLPPLAARQALVLLLQKVF